MTRSQAWERHIKGPWTLDDLHAHLLLDHLAYLGRARHWFTTWPLAYAMEEHRRAHASDPVDHVQESLF